MECYVYLWEISGRVRLGFSFEPSDDLRALEHSLGARASRVFAAPITTGLKRAAHTLLGKRTATYIPLAFDSAKEILISSSTALHFTI